jgi:hypothetical protein
VGPATVSLLSSADTAFQGARVLQGAGSQAGVADPERTVARTPVVTIRAWHCAPRRRAHAARRIRTPFDSLPPLCACGGGSRKASEASRPDAVQNSFVARVYRISISFAACRRCATRLGLSRVRARGRTVDCTLDLVCRKCSQCGWLLCFPLVADESAHPRVACLLAKTRGRLSFSIARKAD